MVNDVLYEFDFEPSQIATLWMCVDERTLVSARLQPLRSIDRLRAAVKNGETFDSSGPADPPAARPGGCAGQIVRAATERVDKVEDGLLLGRVKHSRARLGALRQVLVRLRPVCSPRNPAPSSACSTNPLAGSPRRTYMSCAIPLKSSLPCSAT